MYKYRLISSLHKLASKNGCLNRRRKHSGVGTYLGMLKIAEGHLQFDTSDSSRNDVGCI